MKFAISVEKALKENVREWKVLSLSLLFAPIFIVLMYLGYGREATTYRMTLLDHEQSERSSALVRMFEEEKSQDGSDFFLVMTVSDEELLKSQVVEKETDIGIVIPKGYLAGGGTDWLFDKQSVVQFYGSLSNARYAVAAIVAANAVYEHGMDVQELVVPEMFRETFLEKRMPQNEYESMVPGLLSLAVLMILFTCTASIAKENDQKTIIRLKLSALGSFNYLGGVCVVQAIIASASLLLAYVTAILLDYKTEGSLGALLLVGVISSLSMVAVSLVLACFLNSVFDVLTIGCLPFFVIMFFSGGMFPLPKLSLLTIAGQAVGPEDIIPLTHTVNAFNKILTHDADLDALFFDISAILLLTVVYMVVGMFLYKKRRL